MNKGVEIEGEIDEEEPEVNENENAHSLTIKSEESFPSKNIGTKPKFKNINEMIDYFTKLNKEENESALKKAEDLS